MQQEIYDKNIIPLCEYCLFSGGEDDALICTKINGKKPDKVCRKYVYDATKRVPRKDLSLPVFTAADFDINK